MPRPRPTIEKRCPQCRIVKPLSEFYSGEKYDGGYSAYCKSCYVSLNQKNRNKQRDNKTARAAYARNPDKFKAISKRNIEKMRSENPAKYRAKKFFDGKLERGEIAPDVTREYIEKLFRETTHCQCCGRELCLAFNERCERSYHANYLSPSIDRVDNNKGYVRSNMAIICWECNHRKTDLTLEDLEMFISYIKIHGGSNVV